VTSPHDEPRTYQVAHATKYEYSGKVSVSYGRAHLLPRSGDGQVVVSSAVQVHPVPDELRSHVDFFGNQSTFYSVRTAHRMLRVTATSKVRVERRAPTAADLDGQSWELARERAAADPEARMFTLRSPLVPTDPDVLDDVRQYAAPTFTSGRPVGAALAELISRIKAEFAYEAGSTTVKTPLSEVLERREGVCQDFAHVAVACLRSVGLPARYVSGYLETTPPPGQPRLQGADASHAWLSVFVAGVGWVDLDPTNNQFVDSRYVVAGWGRDYSDVPPLKGVVMTRAKKSTLTVGVDVTRVG
jgi:transglutaminase-like putative cysteine protease